MDELHMIAKVYYNAAPSSIKRLADEFANSMPRNRNGEVTLQKYLTFMENGGYTNMRTRDFFEKLNKKKTGALRNSEIMTLFYIINSGRPFCDRCSVFMEGLYFTCTTCFNYERTTFNVCSSCFSQSKFKHDHNEFLDNFVLLETKRIAELKKRRAANNNNLANHSNSRAIVSHSVASRPSSSSHAIVPFNPRPRRTNWRAAMEKTVEMGIGLGLVISNLCSIM